MVGEIAHVVYGARMLSFLGDAVSHTSYWNGILFPHIRSVHTRTRHPVHPHGVTRTSLVASNDFLTGIRVHSWVEHTKQSIDAHRLIDELLPTHPLTPYARSLAEDELLYDAYQEWDSVRKALRIIQPDELYYVHERSSIKKWHDTVSEYIQTRPNDESRIRFAHRIGISRAVAVETNALIQALLEDRTVHESLEHFIRELEYTIR